MFTLIISFIAVIIVWVLIVITICILTRHLAVSGFILNEFGCEIVTSRQELVRCTEGRVLPE